MLGAWTVGTAAAVWLSTRQWRVRTESTVMGAL
jgi:hypothetical protein